MQQSDFEKSKKLIIFPDFQKLKDEVERLRIELSMLLLERDELQFVICKNIEMEYMLKLGSIEYQAYEAQCTFLRLKRKMELIQSRKNRQEQVNLFYIEKVLEEEFAEYQQKLNEQIDKMNDALERSQSELLSAEESRELKLLYRKIVKVLHPDINPALSDAQLRLFNNAVRAYENGDLATLQTICEMMGAHTANESHNNAMNQLTDEKKRLEGLLKTLRESIEKQNLNIPIL